MKKTNYTIFGLVVLVVLVAGVIFVISKTGPLKKAASNPVDPPAVKNGESSGSMSARAGTAAEKAETKTPPAQAPEPEAPTVEIPKEKQQLLGVKVATAMEQSLTKTIRTVGLVEYDQRNLQTINTKFEGWIEKLYINFIGMPVKKGDAVAEVYSPELWATQQEFINVVRWAKQARGRSAAAKDGEIDIGSMINKDAQVMVEAARQRLKLWDISEAQIRKVEESEKPIRTLTIYSPYSGYVLQRNVTQGSRVMPGEKLIELADLSRVWVTADIYEYEYPLIKVGDTALVQLSYIPGQQFPAKIDYVYPYLQGETRTLKVRFTLPNKGGQLKPQMFTDVELKIDLGRKLAVPADAVINTGLRYVVYVDKGDGNFEPKEVIPGTQTKELVEIRAGLKAGDRVASSANFLIDSEAKLKGVEPLPRQKAEERQLPAKAPSKPPPVHNHGG